MSRQSARPIISSSVRKPSSAISSRTSCAMKRKKFSTNSGLPANFFRSSGSCVAMPTGQVFRWQTRIITQPMTTSGAVAKLVQDEDLLCLGEAKLPGQTRVLDARQRRGTGAAIVTRDEHDVGMRLRDAGSDRAHPAFSHELHVNPRAWIRVLQVVNELCEILDRIDVMVRRWRNEPDSRRRVAHLRDPRIHLVSGQLAALAGLGALRHLDLQV